MEHQCRQHKGDCGLCEYAKLRGLIVDLAVKNYHHRRCRGEKDEVV